MVVRGAPLIGVTAAYGLALAMRADASDDGHRPRASRRSRRRGRPRSTCAGRSTGCRRAPAAAVPDRRPRRLAFAEAGRIADEDVASCRRHRRARRGADPPTSHATNAAGRSTCSPIATPAGSPPSTGAPRSRRSTRRTRPACRSTSGSTRPARATRARRSPPSSSDSHGVPHTVIADNAGGHLMQHGAGRPLHRRLRPDHGERRRLQQDRHLPEGAGRPRQRRAVLRGAAVLDHRLDARRRRRATSRSRSATAARSPT